MLSGLLERLAGSGIDARAAVADSWGAAHALARYATRPIFIAPPGMTEATIGNVAFRVGNGPCGCRKNRSRNPASPRESTPLTKAAG